MSLAKKMKDLLQLSPEELELEVKKVEEDDSIPPLLREIHTALYTSLFRQIKWGLGTRSIPLIFVFPPLVEKSTKQVVVFPANFQEVFLGNVRMMFPMYIWYVTDKHPSFFGRPTLVGEFDKNMSEEEQKDAILGYAEEMDRKNDE